MVFTTRVCHPKTALTCNAHMSRSMVERMLIEEKCMKELEIILKDNPFTKLVGGWQDKLNEIIEKPDFLYNSLLSGVHTG